MEIRYGYKKKTNFFGFFFYGIGFPGIVWERLRLHTGNAFFWFRSRNCDEEGEIQVSKERLQKCRGYWNWKIETETEADKDREITIIEVSCRWTCMYDVRDLVWREEKQELDELKLRIERSKCVWLNAMCIERLYIHKSRQCRVPTSHP